MEMSKQEYQKFVQARAKSSPLAKDCALAFVIGGGICVVGQAIMDGFMGLGLEKTDAATLVPVTGFANAVVSPAIDFKSEGMVTGMAAKMFTVAGPVIVFGVAASVVYGVILMLL